MAKTTATATVFPTLYALNKRGNFQEWQVTAVEDRIVTTFGLTGGKEQKSIKRCKSTNVGRANERNATEQARFEAEAMWKKQVRLGYRESVEDAKQCTFGPMLAHKFKGREKKVQYPVDVQTKLNGARCFAFMEGEEIVLQSRGNKLFDLPHLLPELEERFTADPDLVLDGELYAHGYLLQTIMSWIKRKGHPKQHLIQFHVYDTVNDDVWSRRRSLLKAMLGDGGKLIKRVKTYTANSGKEVWALHDKFVKNGYEGAMVRIREGLYDCCNRSYDLLKVKHFDDDEFIINAVSQGRGKMTEAAIFQCVTKDGKYFDCVMRGTMEQRREHFRNRTRLVGHKLTVRFFGYSADGIPIFPVGVAVRDYE